MLTGLKNKLFHPEMLQNIKVKPKCLMILIAFVHVKKIIMISDYFVPSVLVDKLFVNFKFCLTYMFSIKKSLWKYTSLKYREICKLYIASISISATAADFIND